MYLFIMLMWALFSSNPSSLKASNTNGYSLLSTPIEEDCAISDLYYHLNLKGKLDFEAFNTALNGVNLYHPTRQFVAIADFGKSSDCKRLFIVDVENKKLVLNTWVAHGKNSGEKIATTFSNIPESFMSSPGFYMVNDIIVSPKHGQALLLEGLEKGINDNARKREIIIHGADYVSEKFITNTGRIGRSYGCPAVSREDMAHVSDYLAGGSLLYIYCPLKK